MSAACTVARSSSEEAVLLLPLCLGLRAMQPTVLACRASLLLLGGCSPPACFHHAQSAALSMWSSVSLVHLRA